MGVVGKVSSLAFLHFLGSALKIVLCIDQVVHWDLVSID